MSARKNGPGRPRAEKPLKVFSVRLTAEDVAKVRQAARAKDLTTSAFVRRAILQAVLP